MLCSASIAQRSLSQDRVEEEEIDEDCRVWKSSVEFLPLYSVADGCYDFVKIPASSRVRFSVFASTRLSLRRPEICHGVTI
ncbi:hypothetical protein MRB53_038514 [Persea americana]|nr:hypothetical protein MRB53_038514 [Persea americana]